MLKKFLIAFLVVLLFPHSSYSIDTSAIMSDFRMQNIMAGSAPQQATNGTYRTVELLNLWATDKGLDAASIMSDCRMQDIMAGSAPQ
tara:strand:- start:14 stop:274 length:261 start_codon:yes stop_codon:yes gene_type:complete